MFSIHGELGGFNLVSTLLAVNWTVLLVKDSCFVRVRWHDNPMPHAPLLGIVGRFLQALAF